MKQVIGAAVAMCLVIGTAMAINVPLENIEIFGVTEQGGPDDINTGQASGKAKVNEKKGTFSAKLKGVAPNASGEKAKFDVSFEQQIAMSQAIGDAIAKYSKPKSKLDGDSKASVKAKGTVEQM